MQFSFPDFYFEVHDWNPAGSEFGCCSSPQVAGRRKALAVMPLDDGCFRDLKLRTPSIKAAPTRPSGRLSARSKAKRGQIWRRAPWTAGSNVFSRKIVGRGAVRANTSLQSCERSGPSNNNEQNLVVSLLASLPFLVDNQLLGKIAEFAKLTLRVADALQFDINCSHCLTVWF